MIKEIFNGIQDYFSAYRLLNELNLWRFFKIPIIVSFILGIVIIGASWGFSDDIGGYIASVWTFSWGKQTVIAISNFIGGLIVLAFGIVIFKHALMIIVAPFMSPISEKIERHIYGIVKKPGTGFKAQTSAFARGIQIGVRNAFIEILWIIPFFIFSFIPVIGVVFLVLIFLVQAYYAGFGNMDYTLERYFPYQRSVQYVRAHRGIAIGNGIVFMLILLIPVVGILFVLPLSAVAGTLSTLRELHTKK
ncbi:putative sulfate transport protein CysZ [Kordia sp. SMS9]|uniref:EI24 domain-containing protein n=1 Tax=Kordia sp. SMS9 TaxID=2282170 RepID=UPI000E0CE63D|nr:EI24 domain-containing protein [Kordia sp. SMS9]AXG69114.1 putative sulfate transport protein CysZ [Kordia sp. SMS9]